RNPEFVSTKMFLQVSVCFALLTSLASYSWGTQIFGAWKPSHPESNIVNFAASLLKKTFADRHEPPPRNMKVIGSKSQVVAGVRYGIYFLVTTADKKLELCEVFVVSIAKDQSLEKSGPIECGVPNGVVAQMERKGNARRNIYLKSINKPKLIKKVGIYPVMF
ncbi:hypothetical protein PoB_004380500, partial [Plakobranchus ocellatus]